MTLKNFYLEDVRVYSLDGYGDEPYGVPIAHRVPRRDLGTKTGLFWQFPALHTKYTS